MFFLDLPVCLEGSVGGVSIQFVCDLSFFGVWFLGWALMVQSGVLSFGQRTCSWMESSGIDLWGMFLSCFVFFVGSGMFRVRGAVCRSFLEDVKKAEKDVEEFFATERKQKKQGKKNGKKC